MYVVIIRSHAGTDAEGHRYHHITFHSAAAAEQAARWVNETDHCGLALIVQDKGD